jgi:glutaconate CoA-transferase subunit B
VRLPGGGGAPEIAIHCGQIFITMAMGSRAFVETLPFITSFGHGTGKGDRAKLGLKTRGPTKIITDLCVMEPDPETSELTVVSLHPGVTREQVQAGCGWPLRFAAELAETPAASVQELAVLRDLHIRTKHAHGVAA